MVTAAIPSDDRARARQSVTDARRHRLRRRTLVIGTLLALLVVAVLISLTIGRTNYSLADVFAVIRGEQVPGASYTVGRLRLPRTSLAVIAGLCFGLGGAAFQIMLRNPLASPDVIGISAGAGTAASFAIVVLGLGSTGVSVFAIAGGLAVAFAIYVLSYGRTSAGPRMVLIGIAVAAMLYALTSWILSTAGEWDLQQANRWLTGSLNNATWQATVPVAIALAVLAPILLNTDRALRLLQMGDETAGALGVRVDRTRLVTTIVAVGLIAFATSATGPIAFVAFLSGPIAVRLLGRGGGAALFPSALVGAVLVLVADFCAQYAFGTRFPVGVVTGVLGAPFLVYLIIRSNRAGGVL